MIDWRRILAEHGSRVWRTAYRLLNQYADAQDCYQETFLAACQFARRNEVIDWESFLTSLATRRAIDRLRQRLRSRRRFTRLDDAVEPATHADCPIQQASAVELLERVREELAKLPDKQAEVFWLSCMEGFPHPQISLQMQITPNEVRVLLHRARTNLRHVLESTVLDERKSHEC